MSTASIQAFLGGVAAGHDLDSVKANIAEIVNRLLEVPYSYVFIANLPHIDTIGSLFSKNDIETLATFNNPDVTVMDGNQLIGFDPFVGDYSQAETSISRALNTDNTTLNNTISNVLADDSKFLSQDEINLINQRIDQINNNIKSIADANQNVILVDMKEFYNQLIDGGIELESKTLTKAFGQGFFGLDGYYPSYSGYSLIANEFIQKINDAHIGLDMDLIDVNNNVLTVDPYSIDEDGDGFFPTPGAYPTVTSIPIFDPILEGWVDCDDNNNAVYPEFVSGEPCD